MKKIININKSSKKGFTLLELLIVIAIIAILSVVVVLVLNPSEILKKSRDSQRIADLNTLKTALGIYLTTASTTDLGPNCLGAGVTTARISYSKAETTAPTCAGGLTVGSDADGSFNSNFCWATDTPSLVNGSGWVPVNFNAITGGSPISNLPLDPVNNVASINAPTSTDLVYRYACQKTATSPKPSNVFEIDARLESAAYGPGGTDDKSASDGGDNSSYYEVGTSLRLIGNVTSF